MNEFDEPDNPNKGLIWEEAIVRAAAEVKPTVTGKEINSTKKPKKSQKKHFKLIKHL